MKKCLFLIAAMLFSVPAPRAAGAPETAPDFSLTRLGGGTVKMSALLEEGYVVLNFWARWCDTCKEEIPELARLMKAPGADKAAFIGIEVGDKAEKVEKFVEKFKYPYAVALDRDKSVAKKYGVLGLPATLIVAGDGRIVFRGSRPPETFDFTAVRGAGKKGRKAGPDTRREERKDGKE